jgi:hypothetical protein
VYQQEVLIQNDTWPKSPGLVGMTPADPSWDSVHEKDWDSIGPPKKWMNFTWMKWLTKLALVSMIG